MPALYGTDPIDTAQLSMQTADYVWRAIRRDDTLNGGFL